MKHVFSAFALIVALALPGCREGCIDETAPAPACYSGTVVGATCMDGLLIEVDKRFPIGTPYSPHTNLVAAVNMQAAVADLNVDGKPFKVGETISFTYTVSPQGREAVCPQNTVSLPIPHLVLSNAGTFPCAIAGSK